jgi:hypothetical protein
LRAPSARSWVSPNRFGLNKLKPSVRGSVNGPHQAHPGREDRRGFRNCADPTHVHLQAVRLKAGVGGFTVEGSRNAWGHGFIDIVLFITGVAAVGLAALAASETETGLPVAAGAIVAGLGALSVLLIIISLISPPDFGADLSGTGIDHTRKIGVWLGLIAAIGVAYGGWRAMQEEGTSFGGEADRFRGAPGEGPGAGPPSAPPPPPPPPSEAP